MDRAGKLERIGKYDVLDVLGQGGMGVVYRARDPVIGRQVAIKVILDRAMDAPAVRERFYREARSAGALSHENVMTIYDVGEDEGRPYIVMELLDGTDLRHVLARRPLPSLDTRLDIALQVCNGLGYAHSRGVVHRDIKPENVQVTTSGRVKLLDFGIARIQTEQTLTQAQIGTPRYMSPEQIKGEPIDGRTDIFSFGVLLYELLSGANPFHGEHITSVIYKVLHEDPPPPALPDTQAGRDLQRVVTRCLAKSPHRRYAKFAEVADALRVVRSAGFTDVPEPPAARPGLFGWLRRDTPTTSPGGPPIPPIGPPPARRTPTPPPLSRPADTGATVFASGPPPLDATVILRESDRGAVQPPPISPVPPPAFQASVEGEPPFDGDGPIEALTVEDPLEVAPGESGGTPTDTAEARAADAIDTDAPADPSPSAGALPAPGTPVPYLGAIAGIAVDDSESSPDETVAFAADDSAGLEEEEETATLGSVDQTIDFDVDASAAAPDETSLVLPADAIGERDGVDAGASADETAFDLAGVTEHAEDDLDMATLVEYQEGDEESTAEVGAGTVDEAAFDDSPSAGETTDEIQMGAADETASESLPIVAEDLLEAGAPAGAGDVAVDEAAVPTEGIDRLNVSGAPEGLPSAESAGMDEDVAEATESTEETPFDLAPAAAAADQPAVSDAAAELDLSESPGETTDQAPAAAADETAFDLPFPVDEFEQATGPDETSLDLSDSAAEPTDRRPAATADETAFDLPFHVDELEPASGHDETAFDLLEAAAATGNEPEEADEASETVLPLAGAALGRAAPDELVESDDGEGGSEGAVDEDDLDESDFGSTRILPSTTTPPSLPTGGNGGVTAPPLAPAVGPAAARSDTPPPRSPWPSRAAPTPTAAVSTAHAEAEPARWRRVLYAGVAVVALVAAGLVYAAVRSGDDTGGGDDARGGGSGQHVDPAPPEGLVALGAAARAEMERMTVQRDSANAAGVGESAQYLAAVDLAGEAAAGLERGDQEGLRRAATAAREAAGLFMTARLATANENELRERATQAERAAGAARQAALETRREPTASAPFDRGETALAAGRRALEAQEFADASRHFAEAEQAFRASRAAVAPTRGSAAEAERLRASAARARSRAISGTADERLMAAAERTYSSAARSVRSRDYRAAATGYQEAQRLFEQALATGRREVPPDRTDDPASVVTPGRPPADLVEASRRADRARDAAAANSGSTAYRQGQRALAGAEAAMRNGDYATARSLYAGAQDAFEEAAQSRVTPERETVVSPVNTIGQLAGQLQRAFESENLGALRSFHPYFNRYSGLFDNADDIRATVATAPPDVSGTRATVAVTLSLRYETGGRTEAPPPVRLRWTLEQRGSTWRLVDVASR